MNVTERRVDLSLHPDLETQYIELLYEYFAASERNGRVSAIDDKKQLMAVKEHMMDLCNRNPQKTDVLKKIIKDVQAAKEKAIVISRSGAAVDALAEALLGDNDMSRTAMQLSGQLSVHEVNELINRFAKSSEVTALLMTDAANPGLDVTAANHIIHYDYPARYAQIMQRNHRITRQTSYHKEAHVYYLVTEGKIDELDFRACMKEHEAKDVANWKIPL